MGDLYDAPNQEVVRADGSGPGAGEEGPKTAPTASEEPSQEGTPSLDEMTKAQLLEHAKSLGVTPANNDMTKEELRAAIDEHQGGET